MSSKNKITLIFIINGVDVPVEANLNAPLKVARDKALKDSNNTGRPLDEWEVHTEEGGEALDVNIKCEDLGLNDGDRLLLSLEVAAGGSK